jgi:cell wall-associated NlpC family hydrolase
MHSPKLRRGMSLLAAATVSTAVIGATPALAQPGGASDAAKKLQDLSRQAEQVTEDVKKAQDDHAAKQAELGRSTAEAGRADQVAKQAKDQEEQFRGQVDQFTSASYTGARMNNLSALVASKSPHDYLDRASALEVLAKQNNESVHQLADASRQAADARVRAQKARASAAKAEADAGRLEQEITQRKAQMDGEIAQVKKQFDSLSGSEKQKLKSSGPKESLLGGTGAAITAVNAALAKQGSSYAWGAKGPSSFDCSGLVQYAFEQAGVSLPSGTKAQMTAGTSASESDLKPGDVIFFFSSGSHTGIYIGGGKIVHAPSEGQDVKVENYKYIGPVKAVRRYA